MIFSCFSIDIKIDIKDDILPIKEVSGSSYDELRDFIWFNSDSGNSKDEFIYYLDLKSKNLYHKKVKGFKNYDWEAICLSPDFNDFWLFDIGNNRGKRLNLYIARFNIDLSSDFFEPTNIFTVNLNGLNDDFEAAFIYDEKVFLISKNNYFFDKDSFIYYFDISDIDFSVKEIAVILNELGSLNYIKSITDCEVSSDILYILSYNGLYSLDLKNIYNNLSVKKIDNFFIGQVESLSNKNENFYITSESGKTVVTSYGILKKLENTICILTIIIILLLFYFEEKKNK